MKHLHLFENQNVNSIKDAIDIYKKFLIDIKPAVFNKYNEIAEKYENDDELDAPEYGDKPIGTADDDFNYISDVINWDVGLEFIMLESDKHGNIEATYYIMLTDEEIKNAYVGMDAKKYNL